MTRWFTSDQHLDHDRVRGLAGRPHASKEEMNEAIIANFNSVVGVDDLTFFVGDFALGKRAESVPLIQRFNGTKVLVSGNHDETFQLRSKSAAWRSKYIKWGFKDVVNGLELTLADGTDVLVDHFPYNGDHDGYEDRFPELRPRDEGKWLIHGHVHEMWQVNGRQINVGVDAWNFMPVSEDQICNIINGFTPGDENGV